jgi:peptidoglycan hydrolase-like protein with peptidoglycan-binding domain
MITFAQAATRDQSGVIEVAFDRMTMTDGAGYAMNGKLTSTDSAERRQIEAGANPRVVLFGGRGGLGAAIAGAGSRNSPASGILAALGNMLAEGRDVSLPAGTALAVQLVQPLVLRTRGIAQANNVNTVYTAADRIRAAQRELARQNYYRGALNGQLDEPTQRAIVEYQIDKGIVATGNLDWRTARSLGLVTAAAGGEVVNRSALTPEEAAALRRTAQALAGRERNELRISPSGQLDAQRSYASGEVDLWFALSAFADNASLYEQVVRVSGNAAGTTVAGQSLINAARRVDTALTQTRASSQVQNAWASIRQQLSSIASDYGR